MKHIGIAVTYFVCYALTVFLVTPIQNIILPEVTAFASLVFLPHGVRILATWAYGWQAIPRLFIGSFFTTALLTPADYTDLLQAKTLEAILLGYVVAFIGFELARVLGFDFY